MNTEFSLKISGIMLVDKTAAAGGTKKTAECSFNLWATNKRNSKEPRRSCEAAAAKTNVMPKFMTEYGHSCLTARETDRQERDRERDRQTGREKRRERQTGRQEERERQAGQQGGVERETGRMDKGRASCSEHREREHTKHSQDSASCPN